MTAMEVDVVVVQGSTEWASAGRRRGDREGDARGRAAAG
jgi:hypothetical protein